jgi:hypothetical protein
VGKTIQVTSAQVNAARLWIERADRDGTPVPDAIRKLAQAKPRPIVRETLTADGPRATSDGARTVADEPAPDHPPAHPDDRSPQTVKPLSTGPDESAGPVDRTAAGPQE